MKKSLSRNMGDVLHLHDELEHRLVRGRSIHTASIHTN